MTATPTYPSNYSTDSGIRNAQASRFPTSGSSISEADIWIPTSATGTDENGDPLTVNYRIDAFYFYGSRQLRTYVHEIGHALGLEHPGPYDTSDGTAVSYQDSAIYAQDTTQFTIMSYWKEIHSGMGADYTKYPGTDYELYVNCQTPMLHDVAAIQAMYGADLQTRTGDTVYGFNSSFGLTGLGSVYNFESNRNPIITIYDAGGNDTLDVSGFTENQFIDLRPGAYSSIGALRQNVAMALNTGHAKFNANAVIENAVGGSGWDTINGNDAANILKGHGGNDYISGGIGKDTLDGGAGGDTMAGGVDDDTYVIDNASDMVREAAGEGNDTIRTTLPSYTLGENVENLTVEMVTGQFVAEGNVLGNILTATQSFGIAGRPASAMLRGHGGNDTLNLQYHHSPGAIHVLDGGEGADTASFSTSTVAMWVDLAYNGREVWTRDRADVAEGIWREFADLISIENVVGSQGSDQLFGNAENNVLDGRSGNDELHGRDGADLVKGGTGVDLLYGEAGNDTLAVDYDYFFAVDVIDGGADTDTVDLSSSAIAMRVDLEYDGREVWTRDRADVDAGTWRQFADLVSIENVTGTKASDLIAGDAGRNVLAGGDGNDTVEGRGGSDQLSGGAGVDTLDGGAGDDVLIVDRESHTFAFDVLRGGEGLDTLSLFRFYGATIDLSSGVFGSTRFFDVENVSGTVLADRIKGDAGNNRVDGRAGNDTVVFDQAYADYNLRDLAPEGGKQVLEVKGPNGTDILVDIEVLAFSDRTVNVADLNLPEFAGFDAGDVAFQNAANGQVVFANMYGGAFESWGSYTGALGTTWHAGATGNVNPAAGQGIEVFFQSAETGMVVYASNDSGATTWGVATGGLGAEWILRSAADVTGDGSTDALVQHVNSGAIYFTDLAGGVFQGWGVVSPNLTSDWSMVGAGDINDDGFADVVIQSQSTGTTLFADMNGGAFKSWKAVSSTITPDLQVKAVADVSGDGFADVIFQSKTNGATYFADMANGAFNGWGVVATGITPDWDVEAAADVDADGYTDVVFQNIGTGAAIYADMNPADATVWGVVATNLTSQWDVV